LQENTLEATDVVLTTPDALATFLGLLAGHRAFFSSARWPSTPSSALLLAMPEPWLFKLSLEEHWLLRIVHLPQAISQRGYPAHVQGQLHLTVDDPWFADNSGPWTLQVDNGKAVMARGGRGDLRLDIGALASLYSGFSSAENLALAGRIAGDASALALASSFFGGWTPELADFF
jgi:predicted acetyltransferase